MVAVLGGRPLLGSLGIEQIEEKVLLLCVFAPLLCLLALSRFVLRNWFSVPSERVTFRGYSCSHCEVIIGAFPSVQ